MRKGRGKRKWWRLEKGAGGRPLLMDPFLCSPSPPSCQTWQGPLHSWLDLVCQIVRAPSTVSPTTSPGRGGGLLQSTGVGEKAGLQIVHAPTWLKHPSPAAVGSQWALGLWQPLEIKANRLWALFLRVLLPLSQHPLPGEERCCPCPIGTINHSLLSFLHVPSSFMFWWNHQWVSRFEASSCSSPNRHPCFTSGAPFTFCPWDSTLSFTQPCVNLVHPDYAPWPV